MAELLQDGSIRMRNGRILWGKDVVQIIDVCELGELLCPSSKAVAGFQGFGGGGRGSKGDAGPVGPRGLPGIISLIQDEGFNLPLQNTLNFIGDGVSVVNDPGNGRLNITIRDLFAATRIVSLIPGDGTDLTIAAAVAALPAAGGTIFIKQGTYPVAATIVLPDKDVTFVFAGGAKVTTTGLGANPLFKQPAVTDVRYPTIQGGRFVGENLATAQYFYEGADASGQARLQLVGCDIRSFRRVFNVSVGDGTFNLPTLIYCERCYIEPPDANSKLGTTPNAAGTFAWGTALKFVQCRLEKDDNFAVGWTDNFDGDYSLVNSIILIKGAIIDGLCSDPTSFINITAGATFEFLGTSYDSTDEVHGNVQSGGTLKVSSVTAQISIELLFGASLVLNAAGILAKVRQCSAHTPVAVAVDVLAGADSCSVGGFFIDNTTASIRTAAQRTTIVGCMFISTGVHKTILEAGAANRTLVTGCNGIASGGGFSIPGANSLVGADNIG